MVEFITLALDTSTRAGEVVLLDGPVPLGVRSIEAGSAHGRELAPAIADLLDSKGIVPGGVGLVAVGLGPGSYTGVRVGAATALGFALGADCPLAGVSSLAARALGAGDAGETVFVVTDGGHKTCYSAAFRIESGGGLSEVAAHLAGTWDEAACRVSEGWIVTGEVPRSIAPDAIPIAPDAIPNAQSLFGPFELRLRAEPDAVSVGRLGLHDFREKGATPVDAIRPLYLRRSSAEINWDRMRHEERRPRKD